MAAPAAKDRGKEVRSAAVEKSVNPVHDNVESTTSSELWKRHLSNASSEPRNITIHCNKHYAIIHYTLDTMSRVLYAGMNITARLTVNKMLHAIAPRTRTQMRSGYHGLGLTTALNTEHCRLDVLVSKCCSYTALDTM